MAVSVPISASASGVTQALRDIEAAIAKAGQTGRDFAKLDLSHPELQGLANEIRRIQQRFEDLAKVGRGATATAFRATMAAGGAAGPLAWQSVLPQMFTNPAQLAAHQAAVGNYIFQGTRWQQQVNPPAGAVGGGGAAAGGGGGAAGGGGTAGGAAATPAPAAAGIGPSTLSSILGGLKSGLGFGLALSGISGLKSAIGQGIGGASDEAQASDQLLRHTTSQDFIALRDAVRDATKGMGQAYLEAQRLALGWAKMTGDVDPAVITASVRFATGAARAYGMDPGAMASGMGQARNMGLDPRTFATLVGEAASKGGRSTDETMGAILRLSEASTRALVSKSNADQIGAMYAGLNAMNLPGFKGAGAEAVISQLTQGLAHPGGGPAGSAFMYMALSRHGITDPYQQQLAMEGGPFGKVGNTTLFGAYREQVMQMFPGSGDQVEAQRASAMETLTGLNMRQNMALLKYSPAALGATSAALNHAGLDLSKLNETAIGDAVGIAGANAAGLQGWRKTLLARTGDGALSDKEKDALVAANPETLRDMMLRNVATHGQSTNEGTETRESMAKLANALDAAGEKLLTPINTLRDAVSESVTATTNLTEAMVLSYKAGTGDTDAQEALKKLHFAGEGIGSPEPGINDAVIKARKEEAMKYFTSQGATRSEAAGLAAQIQSESGFQIHGVRGDGGLARELLQWHPERVAAIEKHYQKPLADMDYSEQLKAIWWERGPQGPEAKAGERMHNAGSPYEAGRVGTTDYVRPAWSLLEGVKRGRRAEAIEAETRGATPPPLLEFKPLVVEHWFDGGKWKTEELPATVVSPPAPSGTAAPAGAGPRQPAPPAPRPSLIPLF